MRRTTQNDGAEQAISQPAARGKNVGCGCLLVFGGLFVAVGSVFFYLLTIRPVLEAFAARDWDTAECTVVSSQVETVDGDDGPAYRVKIVYEYAVGGERYSSDRYAFSTVATSGRAGKQAVVDQYPPGAKRTCFVNPADPRQAVLNRAVTGDVWFGLIGLASILAGAGVMLFGPRLLARVTTAAARRAVTNPSGLPPPTSSAAPEPAFGNGGAAGPVTLEASGPRAGGCACIFIFALAWNGVVLGFAISTIQGFRAGHPDWFALLFLCPFVIVGLIILGALVYSFLGLFNPRPTVTIGSADLALGDTIRVTWQLMGRTGSIQELKVFLEGQEEAVYQRGTSTCTDTDRFALVPIYETTNPLDVPSGAATVTIPADTMHSFNAPHNRVVWKLRVTGDIRWWPDVNESFPIVIKPRRSCRGTQVV